VPFSTSPCAAGPSICARLSDDVSLADFAVLADLSPHHFGRAFKASTGTPPQVRFRRPAARAGPGSRARRGPRSLAVIAAEHGFGSQQHFTTALKRAAGISPGALRRERRG
jgi:AraC-like DNA-binding protein